MIDEAPNVEFPTLNEEMQREGDEKNTPHPRAMCQWLWRPDSLACGRTRSFVPLAHSGHVGEAPHFTPPGLMSSSGAGDNKICPDLPQQACVQGCWEFPPQCVP